MSDHSDGEYDVVVAERDTFKAMAETRNEQVSALKADVAELVTALEQCVKVVEIWHGKDVFDLYRDHSPEMKLIREALAKHKAKP